MRDTVEQLQKNIIKNVYKELYSHNDLMSTEKEITEHTKITDCSALTHAVTHMSDNS